VTIAFDLHGTLGTVEINIDRYRLSSLTMLSLPLENEASILLVRDNQTKLNQLY